MVSLFRSRAVLAVLSLCLSLAIAEVVGQAIKPDNPQRADGFVTDKTLGWVLPAGQQMQWRGKPANINNLGMRSPAPKRNPQARILMVGDSSMFGDGVTDAETMGAQLARLLPNVDVQNAGVPGYTCIQTRELIERIQSKYRPDVIVSYNQHSDFRKTESHDQVVAAASLGPLVGTGIGYLLTRGILWRRMTSGRSNLLIDEYQDCLRAMATTQQQHGGHVLYVVPFSVDDFPDSPVYGLPEPEPKGKRLSDYRRAMCEVADQTGNRCLKGPNAIMAAGLTSGNSLQDMVHPTALGHATLAKAIARVLNDTDWLDVSSEKR